MESIESSPAPTEKGKSEIPLQHEAKQKSPLIISESLAEFFAENKNIAGFDNPGKSLYTTVTQLVENALDSAESIQELPRVEVKVEEISRSEYFSMIGRTVKAPEKGFNKNSACWKKVKKGKKGRSEASAIYRVTCKDNGRGMTHNEIVDKFGRVFCRTKCRVKQTREKSPLGTKMALIWSKMSTGSAVAITTSMKGHNYKTFCSLDIGIDSPKIYQRKRTLLDDKSWHGAEIKVEVEGNWKTYGSEIMEYMQQMAVITPYADFTFQYVSTTPGEIARDISYPGWTVDMHMPPRAAERRYHPSAVDLAIMGRLIRETQNHNLLEFLHRDFSNISVAQAETLIGKMGPGVTSKTQVSSLTFQQILDMHQLLRKTKFFDPPGGDCLSPAGDANLLEGIAYAFEPDFLVTYELSARVYQGHPFIVEAGVSVGGDYLKKGVNIFRFANRVPLLFLQDADVVTTATKRINWGKYGIKEKNDRIGVFVSIVSTKIPFQGTGLEYIGDDTGEIADAVQTILEQVCIILKPDIMQEKKDAIKREFIRNIPLYADALYNLHKSADRPKITEEYMQKWLHRVADKTFDDNGKHQHKDEDGKHLHKVENGH